MEGDGEDEVGVLEAEADLLLLAGGGHALPLLGPRPVLHCYLFFGTQRDTKHQVSCQFQ